MLVEDRWPGSWHSSSEHQFAVQLFLHLLSNRSAFISAAFSYTGTESVIPAAGEARVTPAERFRLVLSTRVNETKT